MAQKVNIQLPRDLVIAGGWTVEWAAVDAAGADVAGVVISDANVTAADVSANKLSDEALGPFMLVPGPGA